MSTRNRWVLLVTVLGLAGVGWWTSNYVHGRRILQALVNCKIPIFPGARDQREYWKPSIRSKSVGYRVEMDYPSTAVLRFYERVLSDDGWRVVEGNGTWEDVHILSRTKEPALGRFVSEGGWGRSVARAWKRAWLRLRGGKEFELTKTTATLPPTKEIYRAWANRTATLKLALFVSVGFDTLRGLPLAGSPAPEEKGQFVDVYIVPYVRLPSR
jgi:hypothetical protein